MPELPEVETVRRQLGPSLVGATVLEAGSHPSSKFTPARSITGGRFTDHGRRGKFLLFAIDGERELVVHLGMTGQLSLHDADRAAGAERMGEGDDWAASPHLRAWWLLDDGRRLEFVDIRRFGRIRVVPVGDYSTIPTLHASGPEPFDESFDAEQFWTRLAGSRRKLKTKLLSQRPVAGVGNIYADEALWLAEINPKVTRLSEARADVLLAAIRTVLAKGLENGGTTLRDYRDAEGRAGNNQYSLAAYGRAGLPCLRCDACLVSDIVDARTTTWCPVCQRR